MFKKMLRKVGVFLSWILLLPFILVLDLMVFIYLPFDALINLMSEDC